MPAAGATTGVPSDTAVGMTVAGAALILACCVLLQQAAAGLLLGRSAWRSEGGAAQNVLGARRDRGPSEFKVGGGYGLPILGHPSTVTTLEGMAGRCVLCVELYVWYSTVQHGKQMCVDALVVESRSGSELCVAFGCPGHQARSTCCREEAAQARECYGANIMMLRPPSTHCTHSPSSGRCASGQPQATRK